MKKHSHHQKSSDFARFPRGNVKGREGNSWSSETICEDVYDWKIDHAFAFLHWIGHHHQNENHCTNHSSHVWFFTLSNGSYMWMRFGAVSYWGSTLKMSLTLKYWGWILCDFAKLYSGKMLTFLILIISEQKATSFWKFLMKKNNLLLKWVFLFLYYFVTTFLRYDTNKSHCYIHLFH